MKTLSPAQMRCVLRLSEAARLVGFAYEYGWSYCRVCGYVLGPKNAAQPCRGPTKMRPLEKPLRTEEEA